MRLKFILMAVGTLAIVACSSDGDVRREEYLDADYYTRLELPPNLTDPGTTQQLSVPKPTDAAMEKFKTDTEHLGKLDVQGAAPATAALLPALKGVEMKSDNGQTWLLVSASPQQLWPRLKAFWDNEGIPVVKAEPLLAMIETDWVSKLQEQPDASWLERAFNKAEPDRLDKFRMRIQADGNSTLVYVSHSGMEKVVQDNSDYVGWRARCSEAGLEQEVLARLALFLGLDAQQAKVALANYQPYASRVSVPRPDDGSDTTELVQFNPDFYLNETMDKAWPRTQRALDRIGVRILESKPEQHVFSIVLPRLKLSDPDKDKEEHDEIAEASWLMKWIKGSGDDNASSKFKLALAEEAGNKVKLTIQDMDGQPASGPQAEEFRRRLIEELR